MKARNVAILAVVILGTKCSDDKSPMTVTIPNPNVSGKDCTPIPEYRGEVDGRPFIASIYYPCGMGLILNGVQKK